jgi:Trk K+ transport system NAD-binding subunit
LARRLNAHEVALFEQGAVAADCDADDPSQVAHQSSTPLTGYAIVEITISPDSAAVGRRVDEIAWPADCLVVVVSQDHELVAPRGDTVLRAGAQVTLLAPSTPSETNPQRLPSRSAPRR